MDCPVCKESAMITLELDDVEIDYCTQCEGIWLDAGELSQIRKQFKNEDDRQKATEEYVHEIFHEKLSRMKNESTESLSKAKKLANIFFFLCPSYYIPGKQDWGAF